MKLWLFCGECFEDWRREAGIEAHPPDHPYAKVVRQWGRDEESPMLEVELEDGPYYEAVCSVGHHSAIVVKPHKFEMLFESGANALIDSYYREAVSAFATALERFYEHWVKAVLLDTGIEAAAIDTAWRQVSAQSERQYGAFVILYLRDCGEAPSLLDPNWAAFRNDVVHKGRVPKRAKAFAFGEAVLHHMVALYKGLYAHHHAGLTKLHELELAEARAKAAGPAGLFEMWVATVFSFAAGKVVWAEEIVSPGEKYAVSLEMALEELRARRDAFQHRRQGPNSQSGSSND